jgi:stage II sporulation protein E
MLEMLSLAEDKELTEKKVPLPIKSYCTNKGALVDIINQVVESNQIHWYWQRKLTDCRLSAAEQLKATAAIVANLALEINREPRNDVEVADRLKTQAEALGCTLHDVKVEGNGDMVSVNVRKNPCNNNKECFNTVLPLTANLLKEAMTLSHECGVKSKNKSCKLLMSLAERYTVEFGAASAAKGDGNKIKNSVCGDSFAHLKLSQGKEALILSDGMGSGPLAADESSAAVLFLKKLLLAGFDVGVAVKTVNSMLLLKTSPESFATMDMVIIDAYTCATEFLKVGSAPSFIKRVREVSTIDCSSLPAGIIGEIEIAPVKKRLAPGDIIVMVSDGILERPGALNKESWIVNYLRRLDSDIPQDIAASILRQAKKLNGDPITDDMTVIVAKIAERAPAA